jgi:hypothetical protein
MILSGQIRDGFLYCTLRRWPESLNEIDGGKSGAGVPPAQKTTTIGEVPKRIPRAGCLRGLRRDDHGKGRGEDGAGAGGD